MTERSGMSITTNILHPLDSIRFWHWWYKYHAWVWNRKHGKQLKGKIDEEEKDCGQKGNREKYEEGEEGCETEEAKKNLLHIDG